MTEETTPEPEATTPEPILGVDSAEPAPEPVPVLEPAPVVEPESNDVSITKDEYDTLNSAYEDYSTIAADPQAVQMIQDHFRRKAGTGTDVSAEQSIQADSSLEALQQENAQLKNSIGQIQQSVANMEVAHFLQATPDADLYRQDMSKMMQTHPTLTLKQAYDITKNAATATQSTVASQQAEQRTPVPSAETSGGVPSVSQDGLERQEIEKRIMDSKATPSIEDAFNTALKFAVNENKE